jgi:hypothetical protein
MPVESYSHVRAMFRCPPSCLAVLALLGAVALPIPAHARSARIGCCPHQFRLIFKTPSALESFALMNEFTYSGTPKESHEQYIILPFCGPVYFVHRPCTLHHVYTVTMFEGNLPPEQWTARWVRVRRLTDGTEGISAFHSAIVSPRRTGGAPILTAVH